MEAKETFLEELKLNLVPVLPVEQISSVIDAVVLSMSEYDLVPKERGIVKYDDEDAKVMRKFFVAKAVEGLSPRTLVYYRKTLTPFFLKAGKHIKDVTTDDIRVYLALKKADNNNDVTLNNIRRILSSFYGWCVTERFVEYNPTLRIKSIRRAKKVLKPLSDEEMETLRINCNNIRDRAIIEFLFSTGCRVAEVASVNRNDIDFINGEVIVLGKGKKYRTVYLSSRCKIALQEYLKTRTDDNDALFVSFLKPHIRLGIGCYESLVRNIGKKAGIEKVHPHRFRRTAATTALRRGMPIEQVQKMLGHESIATTTIYAQSTDNEVKISHEKYIV